MVAAVLVKSKASRHPKEEVLRAGRNTPAYASRKRRVGYVGHHAGGAGGGISVGLRPARGIYEGNCRGWACLHS